MKRSDFPMLGYGVGLRRQHYSHVLETWIEGQKVFDRSNPQDLRYATGGFGLVDRLPASPRGGN